jgi:hypothetical protein
LGWQVSQLPASSAGTRLALTLRRYRDVFNVALIGPLDQKQCVEQIKQTAGLTTPGDVSD